MADAGQPDVSSLLHIGAHVSLRCDDGFVVTLDPEKLCALERTDEPPRHFQIRCVFVVHPQRSHRPGHTGHGHEKRVNEAEFARSQGMVVKYGDAGEVGRDTLHQAIVSSLGEQTATAADLVVGLLHVWESNRLGCTPQGFLGIYSHPYFCELDWHALYLQEINPPHVPPPNRVNTDFSGEVAPAAMIPGPVEASQQTKFERFGPSREVQPHPSEIAP